MVTQKMEGHCPSKLLTYTTKESIGRPAIGQKISFSNSTSKYYGTTWSLSFSNDCRATIGIVDSESGRVYNEAAIINLFNFSLEAVSLNVTDPNIDL